MYPTRKVLLCIVTLICSLRDFSALAQTESIPVADAFHLDSLRQLMTAFIWGDETEPTVVETNSDDIIAAYQYFGISAAHLNRITTYNIQLKYGFASQVYVLHPKVSNHLKIPIIYHSGHSQGGVFQEDAWVHNNGSPFSRSFIDFFLSKGFDIICIDMPLYGNNPHPETIIEGDAEYQITVHEDLFKLKNPFYYYVAPIKAAIDYLEEREEYKMFVMAGFSGGGWQTTLYSALDTRIKLSFPVAGSIPIPFRKTYSDKGDMEQYFDPFYETFNYSTLYFLGAAGPGRAQLQVLNKYDNCCFLTDGTDLWVKDVRKKFANVGIEGDYTFYFDTCSTWHKMSSATQDSIYTNIIRKLVAPYLKEENRLSTVFSFAVVCGDEVYNLSIGNNSENKIQWFKDGEPIFNEDNRAIRVDKTGAYYALISNSSGAEVFTDTVIVKHYEKPLKPTINFHNGRLFSSWESQNLWFCNGKQLAETGHSITPEYPGAYTVTSINNECQGETSDAYDYGIAWFPNPAVNQLNVAVDPRFGIVNYVITDITGKAVASGKLAGRKSVALNPQMPSGLYILKVFTSQRSLVTCKFWKR